MNFFLRNIVDVVHLTNPYWGEGESFNVNGKKNRIIKANCVNSLNVEKLDNKGKLCEHWNVSVEYMRT